MGLRVALVLVTALVTAAGLLSGAPATAAVAATTADPVLVNEERPQVTGVLRFGRTLRADHGRWSRRPDDFRFRWLRDGEPIRGASGPAYRIRPEDVGTRLRVRVTAVREGYRTGRATSPVRGTVRHRVGVRRTVTYHVETRGRIRADVRAFRRLAQETYDDARGWRGAGVQFRPVRRGGQFTLVLAAAGAVPTFSSGCSSMWSCRVGRYVIINQERWLRASPAWNRGGLDRRDYRHMVVNHETGHWLGQGHRGCPRAGAPAPVMMQQSKGRDGCRFNPWPTMPELRRAR